MTSVYAEDPIQAPEDLRQARQNILAGTVGKKESPVVGVSQKTVGEDTQEGLEEGDDQGEKSSQKKKKKSVVKKPSYSYRDEKVLNWIYETNDMIARETSPQSKVHTIAFKSSSDTNRSSSQKEMVASLGQSSKSKSNRIIGFCTIPEEVSLAGNTKGILMAFCDTKKGKFKLFGDLTPKPEEYSLVASPVYVEDTYGRRFYVDNNGSYVLNSRKNNQNLATFVNTYALDKVVRESIKSSSKNIAAASTDYMNAVKAARTTQETTMVPNAGTTTATNTAKPKAGDYITILGIQMSADLVDKWADYAFQEHPWGFMILPNTKIYIDLSVEGEK